MSWTDEELSDLARKAEADQVFAYQDSFWGEMEAMLPAQKKRFWPFFLGIALPVTAVTVLLLNTSKLSLETANAAKTAKFEKYTSIELRNRGNLNAVVSTTKDKKSVLNSSKEINTTRNQSENVSAKGMENNDVLVKKHSINQTQKSNDVSKNDNADNSTLSNFEKTVDSKLHLNAQPVATQSQDQNREESILSNESKLDNNESQIAKDINRLKFAQVSTFDFQQNMKPSMLAYRTKRRFYSAYGELGFTMGEAYLSNQVSHVQSISLGAGARLTKNKVFIQTGLGFEIEKAGVELNETTREYGYSIKTFENRMNYKDMYRAFLPINIGYMINKHTLQLGVTASYLLSAKMKYAYLENETLKRNETIYGETIGWNSFGMKLNAGYGFAIFPSTTLGANFQVQLMNQLDKNWTKDENKLPISGQVFIRKTIR